MLDHNMNVILYNVIIERRKEINVLIRELSRQTGASIRSIRYYETKGLVDVERLANGYRDYDDSAIDKVKTIQLYLGLGLTTDDIAQIIDCPTLPQTNQSLCKEAYKLYKAKLDEVNEQLAILHTIQLKLQERLGEME
jgi:DNA-binding transcriptional MerR regulator